MHPQDIYLRIYIYVFIVHICMIHIIYIIGNNAFSDRNFHYAHLDSKNCRVKKSGDFWKFCLEKSGKNIPAKFGQPCLYSWNATFVLFEEINQTIVTCRQFFENFTENKFSDSAILNIDKIPAKMSYHKEAESYSNRLVVFESCGGQSIQENKQQKLMKLIVFICRMMALVYKVLPYSNCFIIKIDHFFSPYWHK